ncbi:A/G-specific adenine glycosylase [Endothiovibrio diazotrophicus]
MSGADRFAGRLLGWYDRHGRHDLPWQRERTAYRVWVSEVMLQQTRVETVIPYFERFVARFPSVEALAAAPLDEVLHLWSGLGYYARARNLHAAAGQVVARFGGRFPDSLAEAEALPGLGRSTAAAILAQALGLHHAILDGNVKRVLSRYHGVAGWPGGSAVQRQLWGLAEGHTPRARVADYTQAIMDLGATLCTRSNPRCGACPVAAGCVARESGRVAELPTPKPAKKLPVRTSRWLLLRDQEGSLLLERRPPGGIWGGLWCFPECPQQADPLVWCRESLGLDGRLQETLPPLRHTFSHFHLDISPLLLELTGDAGRVMDAGPALWYNSRKPSRHGLPTPVRRLLDELS